MIKLLAAVIGGALSIVVLIAPGYAPAWLIFFALAACSLPVDTCFLDYFFN
jgi:hypothetical protein